MREEGEEGSHKRNQGSDGVVMVMVNCVVLSNYAQYITMEGCCGSHVEASMDCVANEMVVLTYALKIVSRNNSHTGKSQDTPNCMHACSAYFNEVVTKAASNNVRSVVPQESGYRTRIRVSSDAPRLSLLRDTGDCERHYIHRASVHIYVCRRVGVRVHKLTLYSWRSPIGLPWLPIMPKPIHVCRAKRLLL